MKWWRQSEYCTCYSNTPRIRTYTVDFFELASIGSYINGVYCEIRLQIRFFIFVKKNSFKKQLVFMGVAFILNHSHIFLDVQKSQLQIPCVYQLRFQRDFNAIYRRDTMRFEMQAMKHSNFEQHIHNNLFQKN